MKEEITYTITQNQVNDYIARVLNERHEDYPKFVRGIKEFIEHVTETPAITPNTNE